MALEADLAAVVAGVAVTVPAVGAEEVSAMIAGAVAARTAGRAASTVVGEAAAPGVEALMIATGRAPGAAPISAEGSRGAAVGPYGGYAAGRSRDVTATGPDGRTYTGGSRAGVVGGPGGAVAGGSRFGVASGSRGTVAGGSRWAAGATRFPTDAGLARYSSVGVAGVGHSTYFWSHGAMATRAGYVRGGFGYWNTFNPAWYTAHPLAWGGAVSWAAGTAWSIATWPSVVTYVSIPGPPVYYDYGSTVVYQSDHVIVNGETRRRRRSIHRASDHARESRPGCHAAVNDQWKSLGVFAMVQGDEKTPIPCSSSPSIRRA